jgi:hypothetical protein
LTCSKKAWQEKKDKAAAMEWERTWEDKKKQGVDVNGRMECGIDGKFQPNLGAYVDAPCGLMECVRAHEYFHIEYFSKSHPDACMQQNLTAGQAPKFSDDIADPSECHAYLEIEVPCIVSKKSQSPSGACKNFLEEQRRQAIKNAFDPKPNGYDCQKHKYKPNEYGYPWFIW